MPDYSDLLDFLAKNPPQLESERQLHASLLELMAQCLRHDAAGGQDMTATLANAESPLQERIAESHVRWVHYN